MATQYISQQTVKFDADDADVLRALNELGQVGQRAGAQLGHIGDAGTQSLNQFAASINNRAAAALERLNSLGSALSVGLIGSLTYVAKQAIQTGLSFDSLKQQAQISFTTMLHSAEMAEAMLNDLIAFAGKTPFEIRNLVPMAQQLVAMGFSAKSVIPTLTAIGDAVAGLGRGPEVMQRIVLALGQMQAKGKVSAEEMRQLSEAGISGWQILADKMGITVPEAMKRAEKGLIGGRDAVNMLVDGIEKGTKNVTAFGGMMAAQSGTMQGILSNLADTADKVLGQVMLPLFQTLSQDILPPLLDAFTRFGDLVENLGLVGAIEQMTGMSRGMVELALAIGGAILVAGPLALAITAIATVIGALASPIGLVIIAVSALAVAFAANFGGIRDKVQAWVADIKKFLDEHRQAWETVKDVVKGAWEFYVSYVQTEFNIILGILTTIWDNIKTTFKVALAVIQGDWKGAWEAVRENFQNTVETWEPILSGGFDVVESLFNTAADALPRIAQFLWDAVVNIFKTGVEAAVDVARYTWAHLPEIVEALTAKLPYIIGQILGEVAGLVQHYFNAAVDYVADILNKLIDYVNGYFASLLASTGVFGSSWSETMMNIARLAVEGFYAFIVKLPSLVADVWRAVINFLLTLPQKLFSLGRAIAGNFLSGFMSGFGAAEQTGQSSVLRNLFGGLTSDLQTQSGGFLDGMQKTFADASSKFHKTLADFPDVGGTGGGGGSGAGGGGRGHKSKIKDSFQQLDQDTREALQDYLSHLGVQTRDINNVLDRMTDTFRTQFLAQAKLWHEHTLNLEQLALSLALKTGAGYDIQQRLLASQTKYQADQFAQQAGIYRSYIADLDRGISTERAEQLVRQGLYKDTASAIADIQRESAKHQLEEQRNFALDMSKIALDLAQDQLAAMRGFYSRQEQEVAKGIDGLIKQLDRMRSEGKITIQGAIDVMEQTIRSLPPEMQDAARRAAKSWEDGLSGVGEYAKVWSEDLRITFRDLVKDIDDIFGKGIGQVFAGIAAALGGFTQQTRGQIQEWAHDVGAVIQTMPGQFGDAARGVLKSADGWLQFANSVLAIMHRLNTEIPGTLGELVKSVLDHFKKVKDGMQDTATGTAESAAQILEELRNMSQQGGDDAESLLAELRKMSRGGSDSFDELDQAISDWMDGLGTNLDAGKGMFASFTSFVGEHLTQLIGAVSGTVGVITNMISGPGGWRGGLQGAMSGLTAGASIGAFFGPAGIGIGAAIGAGAGFLTGLFGGGGKTAAQKEQERLQLEAAKQNVAKTAQEMVSGAIDSMKSALELFDKLEGFTAVPHKAIVRFFNALKDVLDFFVQLAAGFKVDAVNQAKAFAEALQPVVALIGGAVDVFNKLENFHGIARANIQALFDDLNDATVMMLDMVADLDLGATKRAAKFADKIIEIVGLIAAAVEAFTKLQTYQRIPQQVFADFYADLMIAVQMMQGITDDISKYMLSVVAKFSSKVAGIVDSIKLALDAFTALREYQRIPQEVFSGILADLQGLLNMLDAGIQLAQSGVEKSDHLLELMRQIADNISEGAQAVARAAQGAGGGDSSQPFLPPTLPGAGGGGGYYGSMPMPPGGGGTMATMAATQQTFMPGSMPVTITLQLERLTDLDVRAFMRNLGQAAYQMTGN